MSDIFSLIVNNKNLLFTDSNSGVQLKLNEILLPLDNIENQVTKSLFFLYLDNSLTSVSVYVSFLKTTHTLVLLNNVLEKELKEDLENLYKPNIIFDLTRDSIKEYEQNLVKNDFISSSYFSNPHISNDIEINDKCRLLLSTSGTTGSPKFVKLSSENIIENALSICDYLPINSQDVVPLNLSLCYSYGLSIFNSNAISGGEIVCGLPDILEKEFWRCLEKFKFTSIAGVPFVYEMLKRIGFLKTVYPSLKYITQAGGNLSENIKKMFYEYCTNNDIKFFVMYGQTEAAPRISYVPYNKLGGKLTSIGIPVKKGKLSISDETGELLYSGPNVFGGYATKKEDLKIWENISILKTGDIAMKDKDGFFFIKGRLKRFAKIFGNRVNLDDVENFLKSSLNISLIACVTINDNFILISYSVKKIDEALIKKILFDRYQIHGSAIKFKYFDDLPKTENGKTNYKKIISKYIETN